MLIEVKCSGSHPGGLINVDLLRSLRGIVHQQEAKNVTLLHMSATSWLTVLKSGGEGLALGVGLWQSDPISIFSVTGPQRGAVFISYPYNPKRNQTLHLLLSLETQTQDIKLAKKHFSRRRFPMALSSPISISCSLQTLPCGSGISVEDLMHFAPNICSYLTGKRDSPCC